MRTSVRASLALLAFALFCEGGAGAASVYAEGRDGGAANGGGGRRALATVSGSVVDSRGNAVANAVVSLLKDGANEIVKQVRSAADGTFIAKIAPGRYTLRAAADGFGETSFPGVEVRRSDSLVYKFNLEPIGAGRTAPERRRDRNDAKWRVLGAGNRRSIFQQREGESAEIEEALAAGDEVEEAQPVGGVETAVAGMTGLENGENTGRTRTQGAVETYFAASSNPLLSSYVGTNFAVAADAGRGLKFIVAGQTGTSRSAPQRLEITTRVRAGDRHRLSFGVGGARLDAVAAKGTGGAIVPAGRKSMGQVSVRAADEWVVHDGVVVVLGLDYSRFLGASGGGAQSLSPRLGFQYDLNARTRLRAAYAPQNDGASTQSWADFEDGAVTFKEPISVPVTYFEGVNGADARALMERSRRLEFGVERVLDNASSVEATAFFDTTENRGVGLMSAPLAAFAGEPGEALTRIAEQRGAARGVRLVYQRRVNSVLSASAGYSFGRGQRLAPEGAADPADLFRDEFFQTAAMQLDASFDTGTRVRTVFRFSPRATVFAVDPFAGRVAVYDPSLSVLVTQDLPTFGLPVRAEAVIDARNLLDVLTSADDGETLTSVNATRRSVRGGIAVRF